MESIFSVIITHYNQFDYWKTAVASVLLQNYANIELIFIDDGSSTFKSDDIEDYISQNCRANITSFKVLFNVRNIGTVKTINKALDQCSGEYITCFAADDALYDKNVLTNYTKELGKCSVECCGIFARSLDCTQNLIETGDEYILPEKARLFSELTPLEQFRQLSHKCCVHIGSMAFTRNMLQRYTPLDERYILIEDWPLLLKATRNGGHLEYADFPALKYRSGGISRPVAERPIKITQEICKDHLNLHDNEIFAYTHLFPLAELNQILQRYDTDRAWMKKATDPFPSQKRIFMLKQDPRLFLLLYGKLSHFQQRLILLIPISMFNGFLLWTLKQKISLWIIISGVLFIYCIFFALAVVIPCVKDVYTLLKKYLFSPFE